MFRGVTLPDVSGTFSSFILGALTRVGIRSNDDGPDGTPLSSRIYRRFQATFGPKLPYMIYGCVLFVLFCLAVNGSSDTIAVAVKSTIIKHSQQSPSLRGSQVEPLVDGTQVVDPAATTNPTTTHPAKGQTASFYVSMFLSFLTWVTIIQVVRCLRRLRYNQAMSTSGTALNSAGSAELLMQLFRTRHLGGGDPAVANRLRMALLQRDFNGDDYEMLQTLDQDLSPHARRGASQLEIDTLPLHSVTPIEAAECEATHSCNICLGPYEIREDVRTLPCLHKFHKNCIDTWLRERAICPVCKHHTMSQMPHA